MNTANNPHDVPDVVADEERHIFQMLDNLRKGYAEASRPYVQRLEEIRSMRPLPPIVFTTTVSEELSQLIRRNATEAIDGAQPTAAEKNK